MRVTFRREAEHEIATDVGEAIDPIQRSTVMAAMARVIAIFEELPGDEERWSLMLSLLSTAAMNAEDPIGFGRVLIRHFAEAVAAVITDQEGAGHA